MKKFDNFVSALGNLKDIYDYDEPYSNVTLVGLVGLYNICFEQAWKAMEEVMEMNGLSAKTGSPRGVIKEAFSAGLVQDEDKWLKALAARNNVAHAYNQAIALGIVKETKEIYVELFDKLKMAVENEWL